MGLSNLCRLWRDSARIPPKCERIFEVEPGHIACRAHSLEEGISIDASDGKDGGVGGGSHSAGWFSSILRLRLCACHPPAPATSAVARYPRIAGRTFRNPG